MSHKAVEVETSALSTNLSSSTTTTTAATTDESCPKDSVTDSPNTNTKSTDDVNKTLIQEEFRQNVARLLNSNAPTDKV